MTAADPSAAFGDIRTRVRQLMEGIYSAPEPRDAATVILLRDAPSGDGEQVYLLRRAASMSFAPGFYVFPGGGVDAADRRADLPWSGPDPSAWGHALGADLALTKALVAAAVRETFEEAGVLLAGPPQGGLAATAEEQWPQWDAARRDLEARRLHLSDLLDQRGLVLRADLLQPWAHWTTPEVETRRYDTRFFLAALPPGQRTREVGGESDRVAWLHPATALEQAAEGRITLLPPTLAALRDLSALAGRGTAGVLAAARDRQIAHVTPRLVLRGEDLRLLMPGDDGYEAAYRR